jgi:hypothetical protein
MGPGAISAFTRAFDPLWAGTTLKSWMLGEIATPRLTPPVAGRFPTTTRKFHLYPAFTLCS